MLFTTIVSLLALSALAQAAPASTELESRSSKYHCKTMKTGKLSGVHKGKTFSFTRNKNSVRYSGDHPKTGILHVEFQSCSDSEGKLLGTKHERIGRLRVKGTNNCVDLGNENDTGFWIPTITKCEPRELTDGQTWAYDTRQFGLYWAGFFDLGNPDDDSGEVCRAGYKHYDDGKPKLKWPKQIEVVCAGDDDEDSVRFFKIV